MKVLDIYSKMQKDFQRTPGLYNRIVQKFSEDGVHIENLFQEMEMESCYVDIHKDISYTGDSVHLHSHSFYELLFCDNGSIQYLLDSKRYRIQKGDIVVIPPGVSHCPLLPDSLDEPYQRYLIWINAWFIHQVFFDIWKDDRLDLQKHYTLLRTSGTQWEYIKHYIYQSYHEANEQSLCWQACLYGSTIQLLVHIIRAFENLESLSPFPEQRSLLDDILSYIENHLADKITLAETARQLLVSESTVRQLFRKRMNISFYRYVTQRRLIAAKSLIIDGVSLDFISTQVGFMDYSTFYRAFKQEYGISPSQFRQHYRQKPELLY